MTTQQLPALNRTSLARVPTEEEIAAKKEADEKLIARIKAKVEKRFGAMSEIILRMDEDMGRWRMDEFKPSAQEAVAQEDAYTSNRDRAVAEKVVRGIASSNRIIRVENDAATKKTQTGDLEDANDNLEYLAIGMLTLADKRLEESGDPPLQDQLAFLAPIRGKHVIGRFLLMKDETGQTVVDVLPIDPRNFVFERGGRRITWSCNRTMKTRSEIRDTYQGFMFTSESESEDQDDGDQLELVHDYYEYRKPTYAPVIMTLDQMGMPVETGGEQLTGAYWNGVIINDQFAKPMEDTYAVKCPIVVRAVGSMPNLPQSQDSPDNTRFFGDSVFALNRGITRMVNRITSYKVALTAAAVDRSYTVSSRGGSLSFADNPFKKGTPIALDPDNLETVQPIEAAQVGQTGESLSFQVNTDWAAGGLADHAISGTPPPGGLSAAALRLLGSNLGERTRPFLKPVESVIQGGLEALVSQYETGSYLPIKVSGKTNTNQAFDREIPPELIKGHGTLTVKLKQDLPQDDQLVWATAAMATQKDSQGDAMVSKQWARENMLGIQDSKLEDQRLSMERANASFPVLSLMKMYDSALARGEQDDAQILRMTIGQALSQMMSAQQNGAQSGSQNGAQSGSQPAGTPAEVSSIENSNPGTVGASPSPNAGQNTAQPRPGGQNAALASVGLIGPGA